MGALSVSALAGCGDTDEATPTGTYTISFAPSRSAPRTGRTATDRSGPDRSRTEQPTTTEDGLPDAYRQRYDQVIDVVADLDCDPTGEQSCTAAIETAAGDDTLLVFPEGEYLIDRQIRLLHKDDFGMVGVGDARLLAPPNFNRYWIVVDHGSDCLFENVTVDVTADNCAPTLLLGVSDGLTVRDVEVVGRGIRDGSRPRGEGGNPVVGSALLPVVRDPDGTGTVERFIARNGGRIGTYNHGDGRVGIFVGRSARGTVRLVDCHLEEFPNNGIYASQTTATIEVEGGTFRNNDISQVRLGSEGSYVDGATVEVDRSAVSDPSDPADYLRPRGVRIESGPLDTAGVTVRNVDVTATDSNAPCIEVGKAGGEFTIEDCRIRADASGAPGIQAKVPDGGVHPPPPEPHSGAIRNVEITGSADSWAAIRLTERGGTEISGVTVDQSGSDRDGIHFVRSPDCSVSETTIDSSGFPLLFRLDRGASPSCLVSLGTGLAFESETDTASERVAPVALDADDASNAHHCLAPADIDSSGDRREYYAITSVTGEGIRGRFVSAEVATRDS